VKQITLRDIPENIEAAIRKEAEEKRLSINKTVVGLLKKATEEPGKELLHHDLDDLFGAWTAEDEQVVAESMHAQRVIDEGLWHSK
jgi:hypothetical protein